MMRFFRRRLRPDEDSVFTTREHLRRALVADAVLAMNETTQVLVLAMFDQTLDELRSDFSGKVERADSGPLWCFADPRPQRIVLGSTRQLPQPGSQPPPGVEVETAILVAERHPSRRHDEALLASLAKAPGARRLGFYVALDDVPFDAFVGPSVIEMSHRLGMSPSERISNTMVSRSLERVQKKVAKRARSDMPASSAKAWLDLNVTF